MLTATATGTAAGAGVGTAPGHTTALETRPDQDMAGGHSRDTGAHGRPCRGIHSLAGGAFVVASGFLLHAGQASAHPGLGLLGAATASTLARTTLASLPHAPPKCCLFGGWQTTAGRVQNAPGTG